jgi:peptidyl-prolyl cis-trans isomerase D
MFGTIRKHQTWLWAVIITLTVISFVVYFSPYSKMNSGRSASANLGSIDGQPITPAQFIDARREIELEYFTGTGHWLEEDRTSRLDVEAQTYKWLMILQKMKEMGIQASDDAAAEMAREKVMPFERMADRTGIRSPTEFVKRALEPRGYQMADFERYVRHQAALRQLISTVGLSGTFITPQDAKAIYEREHEEVATEAVFFSSTNYLTNVTMTADVLAQWYSNRVSQYAIPERIQINYIRFNVTNYIANAEKEIGTNLTAEVENNFQRLGTNAATIFPEAKTPEAVKARIRDELLRRVAMKLAHDKALEFANALSDKASPDKPPRLEDFQDLAKTNGLTVGVTAPFDRDQGPKDLLVREDFTKSAFALTPEEPFGGPFLGQDGIYEVALTKKLPSELPPLDQVRDRVTADYKHSQAVLLARQAGVAFSGTLSNALAQGKGFTNVCADARFKAVALPPFSISTRDLPGLEEQVTLDLLKRTAFSTTVGKPSTFQATSDGGLILFVKNKLPLDASKLTDLPRFIEGIRQTREQQAFNEWFSREYNKQLREGLRNTPAQPKQPPALGASS